MKRVSKKVVMVALMAAVVVLLTGSVSAGQPDGASRFWLESYNPPVFAIQASLVESQTDVAIKYDETGFSINFSGVQLCQPSTLSANDMAVLSATLDYAVRTAAAMPK